MKELVEDVDVNNNEKETSRVHVDVADQPSVINIAHDPFHRLEGVVDMCGIIHCQNNAGDDHDNQ